MTAAAAALGLTLDQLDSARHVGVALVDGMSTAAEGFCLGSAAAAPRIGIVGGASSGDRDQPTMTPLFVDGQARSDTGLVLLLETDRRFAVLLCEHMVPTNARVVVTGADPSRRRITELDGYPAAQRYGALVRDLGADGPLDAQLVAEFPLALYVDGRPYVRSIRSVDGTSCAWPPRSIRARCCASSRGSAVRTAAALDGPAPGRRPRPGADVHVHGAQPQAERKRTRDALDRTRHRADGRFDSFGEQFSRSGQPTLVALAIGTEAAVKRGTGGRRCSTSNLPDAPADRLECWRPSSRPARRTIDVLIARTERRALEPTQAELFEVAARMGNRSSAAPAARALRLRR
jgi:hypothetical protein